jgi:hypothetical protein
MGAVMNQRARSGLIGGLLCVACLWSGCSLIFPFDVDPNGDGNEDSGAATDLETTADLISDSAGDLASPPPYDGGREGASPGEGSIQPGCQLKPCPLPQWCPLDTSTISLSNLMLFDIWGSDLDNLWIVGEKETVLRYSTKSCRWEAVDLSTVLDPVSYGHVKDKDLYAVWGAGQDLYVVGQDGIALRFAGTAWSLEKLPVTGNSLYAVGGAAPDRIFAGGFVGKLYQHAISSWSPLSQVITDAVTGISAETAESPNPGAGGAVFAVGGSGALIYRDNDNPDFTTLVGVECAQAVSWQGVWAASATPSPPAPEVVAVSTSGLILHYNPGFSPNPCKKVPTLKGHDLRDVDGQQASDLWTVGAGGFVGRCTNGTWQAVSQGLTSEILQAVWVSPPQPGWVVAVGAKGTIIRTDY